MFDSCKKLLAVMAALILVLITTVTPSVTFRSALPMEAAAEDGSLDTIHTVIRLVNEMRADNGMAPLETAPCLLQAAQKRSRDYSVTRAGLDRSKAVEFFQNYGITADYWYETYNWDYRGDPELYFDALFGQNGGSWVMNQNINSIGVGLTIAEQNDRTYYYWVMLVVSDSGLPGSYCVGGDTPIPTDTTATETTTETTTTETTTSETTTTTTEYPWWEYTETTESTSTTETTTTETTTETSTTETTTTTTQYPWWEYTQTTETTTTQYPWWEYTQTTESTTTTTETTTTTTQYPWWEYTQTTETTTTQYPWWEYTQTTESTTSTTETTTTQYPWWEYTQTSETTSTTQETTTQPIYTDDRFPGDLDRDGKVSAADAAEILIAAAKIGAGEGSGLSDAQYRDADLNNDGRVDASDASNVLIYAAYVGSGGTQDILTYLAQS